MMDWDRICPKCKNREFQQHPVEGTDHWIWEYWCSKCSCRFTVNYGDKMGGGFDVITIIE